MGVALRGSFCAAVLALLVSGYVAVCIREERRAWEREQAAVQYLLELKPYGVVRESTTPTWWEWISQAGGNPARERVTSVCIGGLHEPSAANPILSVCATLPELRRLHVDYSAINEEGAKAIGQCRYLEELDITLTAVPSNVLHYVSRLSALNRLNLTAARNFDARTLGQLAPLRFLEELRLGGTDVTDETVGGIGELRQLELLHLDGTGVEGSGFAHLTRLTRLTVLYTGRVTDEALVHIGKMPALETLEVMGPVTYRGLRELSGLAFLRKLVLHRPVGDAELTAIADCASLRYLDLEGNENMISNEGIRSLSKLSKLEVLLIGDAFGVDDGAVPYLAKMKSLKRAALGAPKISEHAARRALPGVQFDNKGTATAE
jgi:hypothetical protein